MFPKWITSMMVIIVLFLSGCSASTDLTPAVESAAQTTVRTTASEETTIVNTAASAADALAENSAAGINSEALVWDYASVVSVTLNGTSASTEGTGVVVDGAKITVTAPGTYRFSGSLTDGQILVNTEQDGVVRLILDGVDLHSSTSAPVYVSKAKEVVLVLAENTINTITDANAYVFENPQVEEPNAAIFANSDLTISGTGTLNVTASYNDGISTDDGLIIVSGTLNVTAVDDGIRGKDYLVIQDGTITVQAQSNGLQSDEEEDVTKGYILVENGAINITAGGDAIQAETDVLISGGTFNITTSGSAASTKGIKGSVRVAIDGGTFTINTSDDAIHSNGNVTINGGTFAITTGDDGMHADQTLDINGGTIDIADSYEGIESAVITLNAGSIRVTASDDGINVAGGVDSSGMGGPGSMGDTFVYSGDQYLYIHGGNIFVDANGDGLDINGAVEMTGGTLIVNGPTEQNNGALDYDGGFIITGGTVAAAGSSGMAQAPGQTSSQNSVLIGFGTTQPAGTLVHIQNSAGENILTFAPDKPFQSLAFSSAALIQGEQYSVLLGGSSTGSVADGLYLDGTYSGGSEFASFTVSGATTQVGTVGGGPGGGRRRP